MNSHFKVLIFTHPKDKDGAYGVSDIEKPFDSLEEAEEYYLNVRYYYLKTLMAYESLESDADGRVIREDCEDEMITEKSYSVIKSDVIKDCEIILDESELIELNGLSLEEEHERIIEYACESDNWRSIESEANQTFEVNEDY